MLSEKLLFAINDIDSAQIEETGLRMAYIKKSRNNKSICSARRIVLIAAAIMLLLAMSLTAYAIGKRWSKGMQEQLQATEQQEYQLEEQGLATVFYREEKAVSCSGVTIRPLELIADEYDIRLSFAIDGFRLDDGVEPCFMALNWYLGDDPSAGHLNGSGGFWWETGEDGKPVFTNEDGALVFTLGMFGDYPDSPVLGQMLHVSFTGMGTANKAKKTYTLDGEWSFEFKLPEESPTKTYTVNAPVEGTALTMGTVKLSPLSIIIEYPVTGTGVPSEIIDTMPGVFHLKMADGTILKNIAVGGELGFTDDSCSVAFHSCALHQVIDPEQVTAVILAHYGDSSKTIEIPIQ